MKTARWTLILALAVAIGPVLRADTAALEERIRQLEQQLAAQQAMLDQLKAEVRQQAAGQPPAAPETARAEAAKELAAHGLSRITFSGDSRLRYDSIFFDEDATADRQAFRLRARVKVEADLGHGVKSVFRLASGMAKAVPGWDFGADAISTNQTFTDSFDGKGIWLDQAYLAWTPPEFGRHVTLAGGKFQNPWMSTPMVWDTDVNPEGFYEQFRFAADPVEVFATLGQTVIREVSDGEDAFMLAYQGGLKYDTGPVQLAGAVSFYDFHNYAANFKYAKGNFTTVVDGATVLDAGDFNIVNALVQIDYTGWRHPLMAFADYGVNVGAKGPHADENTAWSLGGQIGQNRKTGQWSLFYRYTHIDANALAGAYVDSDFGNANRQGSQLTFKYNFQDRITFGPTLYITDNVSGSDRWNRLQFNLEASF
ncbi:MAG: hypothetical protein GX414_14055 [Acidobacteria bacterium]|nr:hypothetical protein [Acidobacteriota bacterium]